MNILGKRYYFFALSLLLIVPGLILLGIKGVPLSIDFTGGTFLEVQFEDGKTPDTDTILSIYKDAQIEDAQITTTENGSLIIRSSFLTNEARDTILTAMKEVSGSDVSVIKFDSVGPSIGKQVTQRAAIAVADRDRFLHAGYHRGVRPHPRKLEHPAPRGIRNPRQPLHCSNPATLHQHAVDDR
ncbi:MAG: hypothetical protein HYU84_01280 [Chloroflexi bacterium]|nr:hypothetical protein [Chloroflexota bacterium]